VLVLGRAVWAAQAGSLPDSAMMGWIGLLALAANLSVAVLLYAWRDGDANMRSVWLCTRNDAIGNVAVLLAALGVFGTGSAWPDIGVAVLMAALGLAAARTVIVQARCVKRSVERIRNRVV
jgi:Co/Zn/Cd efflux system component